MLELFMYQVSEFLGRHLRHSADDREPDRVGLALGNGSRSASTMESRVYSVFGNSAFADRGTAVAEHSDDTHSLIAAYVLYDHRRHQHNYNVQLRPTT